MDLNCTTDRLLGRVFELQVVTNVDLAKNEDSVFFKDLSLSFRPHVRAGGRDVTRFQRACQRAGQSPGGRRHNVIQRRGAFRVRIGRNPIVSCDGAVNAEDHGFLFGWKPGAADRPFIPFDPDD
jgi:hypothetical protein